MRQQTDTAEHFSRGNADSHPDCRAAVIRRWRYRDHYSIRDIARRTGLSRNTVRKYLRSDSVEPKFNIADRAEK